MTDLPEPAKRLAEAIEHMSPTQRQRVLDEAQRLSDQAGAAAPNGIKATVALVAGITSPQVLSDILSGRTSGVTHLPGLARTLGLDLGWLRGEPTGSEPDFRLPALRAYRRWRDQVTATAEQQVLRRPAARRDDESHIAGQVPSDHEAAISHLLRLPQGNAVATLLAKGAWHQVAFADLLRFASALKHPEPTHPDHLAAGHALAGELERELELERAKLRDKSRRFVLPPRLFQLTRLALVTLKSQRAYQGKEGIRVDDALEILWRQQLMIRSLDKREGLAAFASESGRQTWTPLTELQRRNLAAEIGFMDRYRSEP